MKKNRGMMNKYTPTRWRAAGRDGQRWRAAALGGEGPEERRRFAAALTLLYMSLVKLYS